MKTFPIPAKAQEAAIKELRLLLELARAQQEPTYVYSTIEPTQADWEEAYVSQQELPLPIPVGHTLIWVNIWDNITTPYIVYNDLGGGTASTHTVTRIVSPAYTGSAMRLVAGLSTWYAYESPFSHRTNLFSLQDSSKRKTRVYHMFGHIQSFFTETYVPRMVGNQNLSVLESNNTLWRVEGTLTPIFARTILATTSVGSVVNDIANAASNNVNGVIVEVRIETADTSSISRPHTTDVTVRLTAFDKDGLPNTWERTFTANERYATVIREMYLEIFGSIESTRIRKAYVYEWYGTNQELYPVRRIEE